MPNWAVGTMKLRGKKENVDKFLHEELKMVTWDQDDNEETRPVKFGNADDPDEFLMEEPGGHSCIWINGSHRNFIDFEESRECLAGYSYGYYGDMAEIPIHYFADRNEDDPEVLIVLPFKAAWSLNEESRDLYSKFSEKYGITIRIYVVEQGWGFFQTLTVNNGNVQEYRSEPNGMVGDKAYSEFVWECPFPGLGG